MPNETASMDAVGKRPSRSDLDLSEQELDLLRRLFGNPLRFPKEFKTWLPDFIAVNGLDIPIGQVQGFSQFKATPATTIATAETETSTTYDNMATAGPEITGLSDGQYILLYSAVVDITSGAGPVYASVKINATEADDADAIKSATLSALTLSQFAIKTLDGGGNNTVTMRYRVDGATTGRFANRRLAAFKFANP